MCTVFRLYGISSSYKPFFFFFPNAPFSFTCSSLRSPMHAQAPVEYLMGWSAIWTGVNATIVAPQLFWVKWGGVAHMTLSLCGAGQIETFKTSEDPSVRYSTSSPTARTQISFRIPGKNAHYELFTNWTQVKAFTNLINTLLIELTGEKERKTLQTNKLCFTGWPVQTWLSWSLIFFILLCSIKSTKKLKQIDGVPPVTPLLQKWSQNTSTMSSNLQPASIQDRFSPSQVSVVETRGKMRYTSILWTQGHRLLKSILIISLIYICSLTN